MLKDVDPLLVKKYTTLWSGYSKNVNIEWLKHCLYVTGESDFRFVPFDIYNCCIEPVLNNKRFLKGVADKNFLDIFYPEFKKPKVLIRFIDGVFYDSSYNRINNQILSEKVADQQLLTEGSKFILKPATDSGQGKSIELLYFKKGEFNNQKNEPVSLIDLKHLINDDFLIQEYIQQHECTSRFNPSSLNSIRVYVYRSVKDDTIVPLHFMQRIGTKGRITDGEVCIGIERNGSYRNYFIDKSGNRLPSLNGLTTDGLGKFQFTDQLADLAVKVARKNIHSRVLGLDFAINREGEIILIEVNNISIGIRKTQLSNGPLFGNYTEEIIDYSLKNKCSFSFYFDL